MIRRAKIILGLALGWAALAVSAQTAAPFPNLPLYFETNQAPPDHAFPFVARGRASRFLVSPGQAQFALRRADGATATVRMQFLGANQQAPIRGDGELPGKINYLVGSSPEQWRTAVPAFNRVRVPEIYPGINLVYYGNQRQLEYDFTVAPGADPNAIQIHFDGVDKVAIGSQGELVLTLPGGEIRQAKPVVYQTVAGVHSHVSGGFRLLDAHTVAFAVGRYDRSLPLVIDPVLSYATYFGGNYGDTAFSVKVDTNGFVYIAGETLSTQFPAAIAPNDDQTNFNGGTFNGGQFTGDAFVAKFGNYGSNFVYLTYLGGSADDGALDVAVDGAGHAVVTGFTDSTNFPVWPTNLNNHAFQMRIGGTNASFPLQTLGYYNDAFVTELAADGSGLVYSSYLGGDGIDYGTAIALDPAGNAYVTGRASSTNFPSTNSFNPPYPYQRFLQSSNYFLNGNAFITEVAAGGTHLLYSTYLGGTNYDCGEGIAVDASGNVYVSGVTDSTNFPLKNPLFPYLNGFTNGSSYQTFAFDGFVAKFSTNFGSLVYSTYLGSTNYDAASRIRCDNFGDAYVVGSTASPTFTNSLGTNFISNNLTNNINVFPITTNVFVVEINPTGSAIVSSVVFGGNQMDLGYDLALDPNNNILVVGSTTSTNFPAVNTRLGYLRATNSGNSDVFVTAFGANFSGVLYSTCLGGNNQDFGYGIAVDTMTNAYIVGQTLSTNFPTPDGLLTTLDGTNDAFLAVIQYLLQPVQITNQPIGVTNGSGSLASFTVGATGTPPLFYQWQMTNATTLNTNGILTWMNLTNGGSISGATNATLTISPATITNGGTYQVIVTNYALGGMATSSPALLLVTNLPVVITEQPVSETNGVGATVEFFVNGAGTPPIFFQWLKNGVGLTNGKSSTGSILFGVTNAVFIITNVQTGDAANYSVQVSNSVNSVTSSNAALTVFAFPTFIQQPVGETVGTGSPVLLTAIAFGTLPLHYHWQFQATNQIIWTNLSNGGVISGATTNQFSISSASTTNTGNYQLVVSNIVGSVTSSVALVVVTNFPVIITLQPVSLTNGVGATVSFTVANSGTPPYFYHWQLNGANLANGATGSGSVISGATNSVLTITSIHTNDMGNYSVIVSNSVNAATSSNATLTVYAFPTITQQPAGETVGAGATVTLAATAFGTVPLHYQWQVQATNQNTWANLANGGSISGATANTLNISSSASTNTANYQLVVTNIVGSVTSSVALVVVTNFPVVITQQPVGQTNGVGATVSFTVTNTGTPPYFYHWQLNGTNLINGTTGSGSTISGVTNNVLTIKTIHTNDIGFYSVVVSNSVNSAISTSAFLDVAAFPQIFLQPTNQTVGAGTTVYLVTIADGTLPLHIQWQVQPTNQNTWANLANGGNISGVSSDTLVITNAAVTNTANYQLVVTNFLGAVTSSVALVIVTNSPIVITEQPVDDTVGIGQVATFTVGESGTPPVSLLWLKNGSRLANGATGSGSIISGATNLILTASTNLTLTISNAQVSDEAAYSVILSNSLGSVISSNATLTVAGVPVIYLEPTNQTVVSGTSVSLVVGAAGKGALSYQWQAAPLGQTNFMNVATSALISDVTNSVLNINGATSTNSGNYQVIVSDYLGSVTSSVAVLTVTNVPILFTVQPVSQTNGVGSTVQLLVQGLGTEPYFQWLKNGTNLVDGTNASGSIISGSGSDPLVINNAQTNDSGIYAVVVSNTISMETSSNAIVLITAAPIITVQPESQTNGGGATANFNVTAVGETNLVYQWEFDGTNLTDVGRISGSATSALTITNLQPGDTGAYLVVVTNLFGSATSTVATLTVALAPVILVEPTNQTVGLGATVDFSVTAAGEAPLTYQWQLNGASLTDGGSISGSTNDTLTIADTLTNDNGGSYSVIVTNVFGAVTSSPPAVLTVLALPQFVSITAQGSTNFTLSGVGGTNGGLYYILTSSNLAVPLSSWTLEGSNTFDSQGQFNFSFTNTFPQQFFILQITN